jgi:hypothetical protein
METKRKSLQHNEVLKATNQNVDTAIISQMAVNEKLDIIKETETILGYKVDKHRYQKAYEYALHKLGWQSKLYGCKYNKRYLAIVTAETYEQQIFQDYINSTSMRRLRA